MICDHDFQFQGIGTWPSKYLMPGSGARERHYADVYFCRRCCEAKLMRERVIGNNYSRPLPGSIEYTEQP